MNCNLKIIKTPKNKVKKAIVLILKWLLKVINKDCIKVVKGNKKIQKDY